MRRAIAALAWLPDEDVEVPSAPDLEAPLVAAGEMVASPVADAASVGAATESTDVAAADASAGVTGVGAVASGLEDGWCAGAAAMAAGGMASVAAAAGAGGAAAPAAAESMGVSPASDCARVIPFEDALSMHDTMEFHLGGRHWLDIVPKKRTSRDSVCNRPSCDDGSA